jgi:hypothetical protein
MSAEIKGLDTRVAGDSEPVVGSQMPGTGDRETPTSDGRGAAFDYFTDAVPLQGDRDLREREERIHRLEQARPRRRPRGRRIRAGVIAVVLIIFATIGLSVLARSPGQNDAQTRSTPLRTSPPTPVTPPPTATATAPRIGLAPAVQVTRSRPHRTRARSKPHPRPRREPREPADPAPLEAPATAAPPPEAAEPEVAVEPPPEAAPEATSPVAPEQQSEPKTSSSSEADRQFGFGR